jgi:hypothetical protein
MCVALFLTNLMFSQEKFEFSGGAGMPELINIKLRYGENLQVGASVGFISFVFFDDGVVDWSCSAEVVYHFAGTSKHNNLKPWYLLGGLGYYNFPVLLHYDNYNLAFYPRIGRSFSFSKTSGINLDVGLFLPLSTASEHDKDFQVLPSGSVGYFVRF